MDEFIVVTEYNDYEDWQIVDKVGEELINSVYELQSASLLVSNSVPELLSEPTILLPVQYSIQESTQNKESLISLLQPTPYEITGNDLFAHVIRAIAIKHDRNPNDYLTKKL